MLDLIFFALVAIVGGFVLFWCAVWIFAFVWFFVRLPLRLLFGRRGILK